MNSNDSTRTYWCDKCQVPVIGPVCMACGSGTRMISSSNLRPVFRSEIDYLEARLGLTLSNDLKEMETWVSTSNKVYFVRGKPFLKLTGGGKYDNDIGYTFISNDKPISIDRSLDEMLFSFKKSNYEYIKRIEYEAKCFIREMAEMYSDRTVFVSFSGGKDSTVVSHLTINAFGRSDILHVFADTTIEAPDTYKYLAHFKKAHPLTPLISCRSSLNFFEVAREIGAPSRILRWCCTTHKTNPLGKIVSVLNPSAGVLAYDGIRKCESNRRSNYSRVSDNHKIGNEILASPILEWTESQIWTYLLYHDLSFNSAYSKGFRRVGCLYCPFNSTWSEHLIRHYYPSKYSRWSSFLRNHAKRMKHPDPDLYVNHGWRVRAGGRGLDSYKTVLDPFPCALSDNAFNYQLAAGSVNDVETFLRPFGKQILINENEILKSFIINDINEDRILVSVEVFFDENRVRIAFFKDKGKELFRKRIEKQLKKLQSCIKCGACTAKCPVNINPFEGLSGIDSKFCISCLRCVSYNCPVVDSLTRRGKG